MSLITAFTQLLFLFGLGVDPGEPALRKKIDTQRASTADLGSFSVAKVLAVEFRVLTRDQPQQRATKKAWLVPGIKSYDRRKNAL